MSNRKKKSNEKERTINNESKVSHKYMRSDIKLVSLPITKEVHNKMDLKYERRGRIRKTHNSIFHLAMRAPKIRSSPKKRSPASLYREK